MDYEQVKMRLSELDAELGKAEAGTELHMQLANELNELLFKHMTLREFHFIGTHMGREMTLDDEAKLIVAAAEGRPLTDAVPLSASAEAAYAIRKRRQELGLSQEALGAMVGMNQAQIAKLENLQSNLNVDVLQKIMSALGQTFTIKPNLGA